MSGYTWRQHLIFGTDTIVNCEWNRSFNWITLKIYIIPKLTICQRFGFLRVCDSLGTVSNAGILPLKDYQEGRLGCSLGGGGSRASLLHYITTGGNMQFYLAMGHNSYKIIITWWAERASGLNYGELLF